MADLVVTRRASRLKTAAAANIGAAFEWYDLVLYAMFAVTLGTQFFRAEDSATSLLLSLGTFAIAWLVRPLGAILIGAYSDKAGRKPGLTLSALLTPRSARHRRSGRYPCAILPVGAVAWAAVGRSLGFTPEGLSNEVRCMARYTAADFARVASDPPVDAPETMRRLRLALDQADAFVRRLPTDKIGLLFLENGLPVQPDPDRLDAYATHAGARRGHWPSSAEISSAMLKR